MEETEQSKIKIVISTATEMDHMRKLIADHMRESLDTSAHVYVITDVNMTEVSNYLKQFAPYPSTYTPPSNIQNPRNMKKSGRKRCRFLKYVYLMNVWFIISI